MIRQIMAITKVSRRTIIRNTFVSVKLKDVFGMYSFYSKKIQLK